MLNTLTKIFSGEPAKVEQELNKWIKDAKPTVLIEESKAEKRIRVLHVHVTGLLDKLCIVIFYVPPEEL